MPSIVLLDEHTSNRIAAGEVIERPASVVKELVENALDAGATRIVVDLEDGGKELIRVTDNGVGMARDDSVLSLQRHATSKISSAEDLFEIRTLGFRGEALPSVASVSYLELATKNSSETSGVRLKVEAGTIVDLEEVGMPEGTTISVRKLFFNTPARQKFLKSSQTELGHIVDLLGRFAVSYNAVSFRLTHNGQELLSTASSPDLLNAIVGVYGRDVARDVIAVEHAGPAAQVAGYVSRPSLTRANRSGQVFFVNRRLVRHKILTHALDEGYRGLVGQGRYPMAIILIDMPPDLVDVNVHPAKAEVRFSRDGEVHSAVMKAVRGALMVGGAVPEITETVAPGQATAPAHRPAVPLRQEVLLPREEVDMSAFRAALAQRAGGVEAAASADPFEWTQSPSATIPRPDPLPSPAIQPAPVEQPVEPTPAPISLTSLQVVGQARNMYIVAECDDGIIVIDQHVAHERVLFERLSTAAEARAVGVQLLMIPLTLHLGRREALVVQEKMEELRSIGFELEPFGGDSFVVRGVPSNIARKDYAQALRDIIDELVQVSVTRHLLPKQEQVLITAACKMAVKAGDPMSHDEMTALVSDLLKTGNPFTCPHGRPIILSLSNWELDKKFHRPARRTG
ncbi:MAG: DNA mismatch repair endonuclease MutL [Armatimonadota bacterium]|nr:DNA mismatch repair endonuclease MutL [Armatimonadota bacterium]